MFQQSILIIHTDSALNNLKGKEALDMSLIFAAFEQSVTLLLFDQAIFQVCKNQDSECIGQKDYLSTFKLLELYDVDKIYVCKTSMEKYGIVATDLVDDTQVLSVDEIIQLKQSMNQVLVF